MLRRLQDAGFHVWPFDPSGWPLVLEIYPRLLTGKIIKVDHAAREAHLARLPEIEPSLRSVAASSVDAFDAAVSAVVMARHLPSFERPP